MASSRLSLVGLVALASCAQAPAGEPPAPAPAEVPVITRLVPDHGPAGEAYPIPLVIEGTGFARDANTVRFGPVTLADLPSDDGGTRIELFVPKTPPAQGEVPPGPLLPGTYEVTVATAAGRSEPVTFTLDPAGP